MTATENSYSMPLLLVFAGSRGIVVYADIPAMECIERCDLCFQYSLMR